MPIHHVTGTEDLEQVLATEYPGTAIEDVLNEPSNAALFAIRGSHMLAEGDQLTIPAMAPAEAPRFKVTLSSTNRFRYEARLRPLVLALRDTSGAAITGEAWRLQHGDSFLEGSTDGDGMLRVNIPVAWRNLELIVGERRRRIRVAALDPVGKLRGIQARLRNLGYNVGPIDGRFGPRTSRALAAFQSAHGLALSGHSDANTRAKLVEVYGS